MAAKTKSSKTRFMTIMKSAIAGHRTIPEQIKALYQLRQDTSEEENKIAVDHQIQQLVLLQGRRVQEIEAIQVKLKEKLEELTTGPLHTAMFLELVDTEWGTWASVLVDNHVRAVPVDGDRVNSADLNPGEDVYLGQERNIILGRASGGLRGGETAPFLGALEDGRLRLGLPGEEELVVTAMAGLQVDDVEPGTLIRYSKNALYAFEPVPASGKEENEFFIKELPGGTVDEIGGLDETTDELISSLLLSFNPEIGQRYGLGRINVLLHGPPGCGKTTLARVSVSEVSKQLGRKVKLVLVNGAQFDNPYVGGTAARIRNTFKLIREHCKNGPVVLVFDECESLAKIRGGHDVYGDKALGSLLPELDGLAAAEGSHNLAVLFLTNRIDLLDPAFLERTTQTGFEIPVGRPGMSAARDILAKKMAEPPGYRYSPNGARENELQSREAVIDVAISLLFAPNGPNQVCTVKTSDGSERAVFARDLISGRSLEEIATHARRKAAIDDVRYGGGGITVEHMRDAVYMAIRKLRKTLSINNAHAFLPDLPTDLAVTAVIPFNGSKK